MKKHLFITLAIILSLSACTSKFYVGPKTADCTIGGRSECFLVKYNPGDNWMLIPEDIIGFIYEEGYIYKIKVRNTKIRDDFNNLRDAYELVEVISKDEYVPKKKVNDADESENTSFKLIDFIKESSRVTIPTKDITLNIDPDNKISGHAGCNNYFGEYNDLQDDKIQLKPLGATKMYCAQEGLSDFEKKYLSTLQSASRMIRKDNSLILTTDNGDSLIFQSI